MELDNSVEWQARPNRTTVQVERWHKDHWSTFAYVEGREVDYSGLLDWDRVRVSARNWPMLYNARRQAFDTFSKDGADYGLRLRQASADGVDTLFDHCEVDAIMDMVDAGLVAITMPQPDKDGDFFLKPNGRPISDPEAPSPKFVTGLGEWHLMPWAAFRLTEQGREVANRLRAHKADGGTFSSFNVEA